MNNYINNKEYNKTTTIDGLYFRLYKLKENINFHFLNYFETINKKEDEIYNQFLKSIEEIDAQILEIEKLFIKTNKAIDAQIDKIPDALKYIYS